MSGIFSAIIMPISQMNIIYTISRFESVVLPTSGETGSALVRKGNSLCFHLNRAFTSEDTTPQ